MAIVFLNRYIIFNISDSLPGYVYWINHDLDLKRNGTVAICTTPDVNKILKVLNKDFPSHRCPTGQLPHLKLLAALPGDRVEVDRVNDIKVNGIVFKNSTPTNLLPLSEWQYQGFLKADRYLVLTHNPMSFDSRYYGTIKGEQILSTVTRIL